MPNKWLDIDNINKGWLDTQPNSKPITLNYKPEPITASTTSVNNNVIQQKADEFTKNVKIYGTPEKALKANLISESNKNNSNKGTLSTTQNINPNDRWMLGAANYKGNNPEQVIKANKQTQAIGAIGAGVGAIGSIPVVSQALGAGFAAKGVHDIPETVKTVMDPNVSLHDKTKAVVFNSADFLGMGEATKGAKRLGDFANKTMSKFTNSSRSVNRGRTLVPQRNTPPINQNSNEVENDYLDMLRGYHHNNTRSLSAAERRYLRDNGYGQERDYLLNSQINNNQLPPPPPSNEWNQVGVTPPSNYALSNSNYDRLRLADDYTDIVNGYTPRNYPNLTREQNIIQQELLINNNANNSYIDLRRPINNSENYIQKIIKPKNVTNKSGLSKNEILEKVSVKDKDAISKMSEQEFENTVLKPNGKIVNYKNPSEVSEITLDPQTGNRWNPKYDLNDQTKISKQEFANHFNSNIDLLNSIIKKNNKSGVKYNVKNLTADGDLIFETPAGQKGNFWKGKNIREILNTDIRHVFKNKIPSGTSNWHVEITPGKWRGEVQDIANAEYFKSIPGINMSNTTNSVFSDRIPRRGTGTYESINQFLKEIDLGRVKPGFNSQTDYSRSLWENSVNKGKSFGFYANPTTVYGSMKSSLPYIGIGGLGAGALQAKDKQKFAGGGWLDKFEDGGEIKDMPFGMPLKEQNPFLVPEYNQPMVGKTILPDINRPILEGTNASEFKSTQGTDQGDVQIPTIVGGQYIGEDGAWTRYKATGEKFKNMTDPRSYSNFYNQVGNLGLMKNNKLDNEIPDVTNAKNYIKGWYNSPMYNNILKNQIADWGVTNPKRTDKILKRLNKNFNKSLDNSFYDVNPTIVENNTYFGKSVPNNKGGREINLEKNFIKNNPKLVNSLFTHELAHDNLMTGMDEKYISKNTPKYNPTISDETKYNFLTDPEEVRSQIHSIRQLSKENKIYDPFTQPFKKEYLNQINKSYNQGTKESEDYNQLQRLRQFYSDDQIIEMMNTISKSNSDNTKVVARNGGWLDNQ